ncbi:MAG TPA: HipA family kinase [Bryobacterales bacterium]|nr:HipA family kinase [Bryobacterales bacterium]
MRGGAQGQLLLASDGHYYIVKFQNNPQHRRVLANEMLAHTLLRHLQLPTPPGEIIEVGPALVSASGLYIESGGRRIPCSPGLQFGSRYPGDPSRLPVYDYLPDSLLRQVLNADCFLGMVVFDKWVSNADGRQAIFFRDRLASWRCAAAASARPAPAEQRGFVAVMIDHGFAFTAQRWEFRDQPQVGIYPRPWLYEQVTGYDSFEPWLGWIRDFSLDVLDDAFKRIPPEWYEGDIPALEQLLEQLYGRRRLLPDLLRKAKDGPRDPFPNWSAATLRQ